MSSRLIAAWGCLMAAMFVDVAPVMAQLRPAAPDETTAFRVTVDEIGHAARAHLERAQAYLDNDQFSEAVDTIRRVMDSASGTLIPLDPEGWAAEAGFVKYVPVRRYCQQLLAGMAASAPAALRHYRSQVDPLAEKWLQQAQAERDDGRLQQIVDEFFVSSSADEALMQLGSRALEAGYFRRARMYWEQLSPRLRIGAPLEASRVTDEGQSFWSVLRSLDVATHWQSIEPLFTVNAPSRSWLSYPDTNVPLEDVRARLVLVSILEGNASRAQKELEVLQHLQPEARGTLGGRTGKYVDLLRSLLDQSREWHHSSTARDWPTFAGNPARNAAAAAPVDLSGTPLWTIDLPRLQTRTAIPGLERFRVGEASNELLSYFPAVAENLVVLNTGMRETDFEGIDLHSGALRFARGTNAAEPGEVDATWRYAMGVPRFTVTLQHDRAYARVGSPITGSKTDARRSYEPSGKLVGIDVAAQRRLSLEIKLTGPEWNGAWAFEGAPLAAEGNLYVALRRRDAVRAEYHVACFDAQQGRLIWRRRLCAAETFVEPRPHEITNNLLTLDEGILYCNSNLGAVAAVRARTGEIEWLTTYPRTAPRRSDPDFDARYLCRDLNPCLVYQDFVFIAPADSSDVFALDAVTGQIRWSSAGTATDAVHLLGVAQERLLASGDCLYWLDIYTGRAAGQFPRSGSAVPGRARANPRGWGRGVLAGHYVYWPTREMIFIFEQATERSSRGWEPVLVREVPLLPRGATGGNLLIADGVLLIAAADRLYAFNETGRGSYAGGRRRSGGAEIERSLSADYR